MINDKSNTLIVAVIGILILSTLLVVLDARAVYDEVDKISIWIRDYFGYTYLYLGLFCVVVCLIIAFSNFGKQRLGLAKDRPLFSLWSWSAMLFSAGMGTGIILRAVQEPVYMFIHPPVKEAVVGSKKVLSLVYTFYHWGFTAWAFYALFALMIGYMIFKEKSPLLPHILFLSHTSSRKRRPNKYFWGINLITILVTIFGLIAAISLGTTQIVGGLNFLSSNSFGFLVSFFVLMFIAFFSFFSAWKGIDKGIKKISEINIILTIILFVFVLFQSDALETVKTFLQSLRYYLQYFIHLSLALEPFNPDKIFLTNWTFFYWAFWLSWAPFTGVFIARISQGMKIRTFLLGTILIPSLGTFFWFSVFANVSINLIEAMPVYNGEFDNVFSSLFLFIANFRFSVVMNLLVIVLLFGFLITSLDSAIFILSTFTDKGRLHPAKNQRLIWSILISLFGVLILFLAEAIPTINILNMVQKMLIITSVPLAIILLVATVKFIQQKIL